MAYKEQRPLIFPHTELLLTNQEQTGSIFPRDIKTKGKAQPQATDSLAKGGANVPLAAGITLIRSQMEMEIL